MYVNDRSGRIVSLLLLLPVCWLVAPNAYCATGVVTNGTEVVVTVESGDSLEYAFEIDSRVTRFVKRGAGTLTVAGDNSPFKGAVDIESGILIMRHCYALGMSDAENRATDGAITVSSGAQLYAYLPRRSQGFEQISKRLILSGSGPYAAENAGNDEHYGALYARPYKDSSIAESATAQDYFVAHVELAADAVLGFATSRIGLKTTDLKGHKLTIGNWANGFTTDFMLWKSVHLSAGTLEMYSSGKDSPGALAILTSLTAPETGFVLSLDDAHLKVNTSIGNAACNAGFATRNSSNDGRACKIMFGDVKWTDKAGYIFKGPVNIGTKTEILPSGTGESSAKFEGAISGAGNLTVSGSNFTLDLSGTGSTATGKFTVSDATVRLWQSGALADYSKMTLSTESARVECLLGSSGWTASDFAAAGSLISAVAPSKFVACTAEGESATISENFVGPSLYHGGAGSLTFTGALVDDATTTIGNLSGDFKVTGKTDRYVGEMRICGGTLTIENAGLFYKGAKGTDESTPTTWVVGGTGVEQSSPARLVVTGDTQFVAHRPKANSTDAQPGGLHIGDTAGEGALVEFYPDVVVTNSIRIAQAENEKGAVHQYGGSIFVGSHNNNQIFCGREAGSYAYYGIYGGRVRYHSYFSIARNPGSVGVIDQTGGVFQCTSLGAYIGGGVGRAEYYMTGGDFTLGTSDGTLTLGYKRKSSADAGSQAVLTLTGDGNPQINSSAGQIKLCGQTNDFMAVVNVNSGTLNMRNFARYSKPAVCQSGNKAFVNFGGGTFMQTTSDNPNIFGSTTTAVDKVTLFPGGMTIDSNGKNCSLSADTPLTRPTGRGIASIALPANMQNGKYLGSPEVVITGGGGTGATAHAVYDPRTKSVTSIDVTCPGWDFTSVPTVTIRTADRKDVVNCIVTLTPAGQDQPCGGLIKKGQGQVTINSVNTYTGDTVLVEGIIKTGVSGAIPDASTVIFGGGRLILDGNPVPSKWGVDCEWVVANGTSATYPVSLAFPEGSTLAIRNIDSIPTNVHRLELLKMNSGFTGNPVLSGFDSDRWEVGWKGSTLVARRIVGAVFIMR